MLGLNSNIFISRHECEATNWKALHYISMKSMLECVIALFAGDLPSETYWPVLEESTAELSGQAENLYMK
jgi:hypothetical protein